MSRFSFKTCLATLVIVVLVRFGRVAYAQAEAVVAYTTGTPCNLGSGVSETVGEIMARDRSWSSKATGTPAVAQPRHLRDARALPQNAAAPGTSHWPPQSVRNAAQREIKPSASTPQSRGLSFLGAQLSDSGFVPPDSMGDIGPSQFLVCVNGRIRVFDRTGVVGPLDTTTDSFFSSLGVASTSDPHVRFDRLSRRWFVVMIEVNSSQKNNHVLIAVSSGPTITGSSGFTFFAFRPEDVSSGDRNLFADYPTLGVDANALYIGANMFNSPPFKTFNRTSCFVVRKSSLLSGTLTVTGFSGLAIGLGSGPFSPQGVDNDDGSATEGYFIGVDNATLGQLVVRRISSPGGTPSISGNINITVPSTVGPMGGVVAEGASTPLDDIDDRLFQARLHHGSLWTAHNIQVDATGVANSSGGRDGSRWYEITNMTGTPALRQSGTLFDTNGVSPASYWIPSCAISGQGHAAIGSSVAGPNEHAEIAVAGRLATDPLGLMESATVAQTSTNTYDVNDGLSPHRWGDFSMTGVDPSDDMTFWTVQEYCNANNSWAVEVIQLKAPPPALPTNCIPAILNAGDTNVMVTVEGETFAGSGFFDPGPDYSNHIAAAVTGGGVTVNGIVWNDPTHVTLNLSVSNNAIAGGRGIVVTNPDGQTATSPGGILFVQSGSTNVPPPTPQFESIVVSNTAVTMTWTAVVGQGYRVQFTGDLDSGMWTNLIPDIVATNETAVQFDVTGDSSQRFYRVLVLSP